MLEIVPTKPSSGYVACLLLNLINTAPAASLLIFTSLLLSSDTVFQSPVAVILLRSDDNLIYNVFKLATAPVIVVPAGEMSVLPILLLFEHSISSDSRERMFVS